MRSTCALRPLFVLTLLALPLGPLAAQRYWHDEQGRDAFRLDLLIPFFKGDGSKMPTGAAVPSLSMRAAEAIRVEADFPFVRAGFDFGGSTGSLSAFRVGNPYIGLRIGDDEKPFSGVLGARIPLAAKPQDAIGQRAVLAGTISNFEQSEAFGADVMTFGGGLEWRRKSKGNFLLGLKGGSSLLVTTDGNPLARTDAFLDYGARAGFERSTALATLALTGRSDPTEKGGGFSGRSHHAATGVFEYRTGGIRPRVSLRIPFDKDIRDQSGAVLGLGISFAR